MKHILQKMIALSVIFLISISMYAHEQTVTGTVKDANDVPLPGVNILIKGTNQGTQTDFDGNFSIKASKGDVIVFTYVGTKTIEKTVGVDDFSSITMESDSSELDEVVLVGYGNQKRSDITTAIATMSTENLDERPITKVDQALIGQMAGVRVKQTSGLPGAGFDIQIRGVGSISAGNQPLYVIDGFPLEPSGQSRGGGFSTGNPLANLNPNDIESIQVLKDAAAAAIYGSRGANGVVLITTKKGKAGKTRFDAHLSTSLGQVSHFMDLMDTRQYLEVRREGVNNDGLDGFLGVPAYDFYWPDITLWDQNRYTDWQRELIGGTAYRNNAQLSVSGGSDRTQFLVSGAYLKETTVFPGDANYKRASVHNNINHRSDNDRFRLNLSTSYTREDNLLPRSDLSFQAYTLAPNAPALFDEDGNLNWENNTWDNPLAGLEEKFGMKTSTVLANALVSYELLEDFEVRASMGYTDYRLDSYRTLPSSARTGEWNAISSPARACRRSRSRCGLSRALATR